MLEIIKHSIAFLYLLAGSISDIKTREVPDWSNYGLIAVGFASNLIFSLALSDWSYFLNSIIGFGIFFILAIALFYLGQWGGGDSKMLMGIGALYGLGLSWQSSSFLISFIINSLLAGALWGIGWSIFLALKNRKKFLKELKKHTKQKIFKTIRLVVLILSGLLLIFSLLISQMALIFLSFAILLIFVFYLWLLIKAVEKSCMFKLVEPSKLTEGDWIAREVKHKGRYICGPKDLGIEKKQIKILKKLYREKKIKKILVKEGIPFVPSFLFGWLTAVGYGNVMKLLLS